MEEAHGTVRDADLKSVVEGEVINDRSETRLAKENNPDGRIRCVTRRKGCIGHTKDFLLRTIMMIVYTAQCTLNHPETGHQIDIQRFPAPTFTFL